MLSDLHMMYSPVGEIKRHIVFIHGLQGDYAKTWAASNSSSEFWPNWLADDFKNLAIWSVSYDAPVSRLKGIAMHLADRAKNILERLLLDDRFRSGEITLVGHSLGGLVIKQLIRDADSQKDTREEIRSFINRVGRIAFLATPHAGSDLASIGDKLRILVRPTAATMCLVRNDPNLRDLNVWYRNWNVKRDIKHLILMETKPTKILGVIVRPDSADPGLKENAISIDSDHSSICKPSSKDSEVFLHLKKLISLDLQPPQIIFLKSQYGFNYQGWCGYKNWVNCPEGVDGEFFVDEHIRIFHSNSLDLDGVAGLAGLQMIRRSLLRPASSVRLTGLSGVGKTRLVQALFDDRIGTAALAKDDVFYADISDQPKPPPRELVEKLACLNKRAIIIIDNCPPELHRRLTSICTGSGSSLSLLTVEYDVREDNPEETDGFRLEPAATALIERIIKGRFKLSQVDARMIAEFSGGNSRIAIALASTVRKGESLARLKDSELFERLFYQRNENDLSLLRAAEALSLVYSFKIDVDHGYSDELTVLSDISGVHPSKLFESISELKRRNLIQRRGTWGAVLPHALANRLAQRALENIPEHKIVKAFETCNNERLLKSFSRRLGYLDDSEHAQNIVGRWLSDGGLLGDLSSLNDFKFSLLGNVAPISQANTLNLIDRAVNSNTGKDFLKMGGSNFVTITRLLRSLAYRKDLFPIAARLLCEFSIEEKEAQNNNSISDLLKSLFYMYLSGTHASAEQRLLVISELMDSGCQHRILLSFELLEASLEAWNFSSSHGFEFGSKSRDHGFSPETREDIENWFTLFVNYATEKSKGEDFIAIKAKQILGNKFRGLWVKTGMYDLLECAVRNIVKYGGWKEGWLGVKSIIRFEGEKLSVDIINRLKSLDKLLQPSSLVENIKVFAISTNLNHLDIEDAVEEGAEEDGFYKAEEITRKLGVESSEQKDILLAVLPELLSKEGSRIFSFGCGLAQGTSTPAALWDNIRGTLAAISIKDRNYQLLRGFINYLSKADLELVNTLLDDALHDSVLCEAYPLLQVSVRIDDRGVSRIKESLEINTSNIWMYKNLAYGRISETIPENELCIILNIIDSKPKGTPVALEILRMRLLANKNEEFEVSDVIARTGQDLINNYNFLRDDDSSRLSDYSLGKVIDSCFDGEAAFPSSLDLCEKLLKYFSNYKIHISDCRYVLEALSRKQPGAFLDGFFGDVKELDYRVANIFPTEIGHYKNPLSAIDDGTILEWCKLNSEVRYPLVASAIQSFKITDDSCEWSSLAKNLIEGSPAPLKVLNKYKATFRPMSWSGSRAEIMARRLPLITSLKEHSNQLIVEWAKREEVEFSSEISSEIKWEAERDSSREEIFEW